MTVGIGIIGIGKHADRYLAPAIQNAEGADLVAVWSRSQDRADAFAKRAGGGSTRAYDDIDALLADPAVQAVIVASPNGVHAEHSIAAARAGKHILLEKPMATNVADAEAIAVAAKEAGVTLAMGFHMRHHPAHQEARRVMAGRGLGTPLGLAVQYSVGGPAPMPAPPPSPEALAMSGGGIAMAIGVHLIDLLRYVSGLQVEAVTAFSNGRPADSHTNALLRMTGGVIAHFETGRGYARPLNELHIYGSEGTITTRGAIVGGHSGIYIGATVSYSNLWGERSGGYSAERVFVDEVADFVRAVESKTSPLANAADGVAAQRIIDAVYQSADTGRTIELA